MSRANRRISSPVQQPVSDETARRDRRVFLLLAIAFVLLAVASSATITETLDEPLHLHYGLLLLQGSSDRIDDSSMPVSALNALPVYIASFLPQGTPRSILERYFAARLMTILATVWFAFVVFRWSRLLYGLIPAVFGTLLFILDPNILANAQLVTTDVFAAGMLTWSLYETWRFSESRRWQSAVSAAVVIGMSQLVKYTAVVLIPLWFLVILVHDWPGIRLSFRERGVRSLASYAASLIGPAAVTILIVMAVINAGFLFSRTFTPFSSYRFRSDVARSIQADLGKGAGAPVPLPYSYLEGLDWMHATERTANRYGNVYLLGRLSKPDGFPGYFLVATALKVPIATLFLIVLCTVVYCADPIRRSSFLRHESFLLLPVVLLTIYFNFIFNAQTGIRYYLVVFPMLYAFVGSLFVRWDEWRRWKKALAVALMCYLTVSVLSYFPYFTPYFNELVLDKTRTYRYLSDTNLEWGQSKSDLARYLGEHPVAVYNPSGAQAGTLIVGGSDLVGILEDPGRYAWLRENFEPVDTIAFAYFVYSISPQEIQHLCGTTDYCDQ